jgi:hypothetical protein
MIAFVTRQRGNAMGLSAETVTVYQDEPIIIADMQIGSYTPPQYRAMRKIAMRGNASCRESAEKVFYKQARFMEDFEDDFDYRGEFAQYFPTYQSMNDRQLRGYFSWRTKVRRGAIEETPLSFVFVYIYELINGIGARSPEEGFYALKNFWTAYKDIDPRINRYIKLWLKDYVVYNNLDNSLLEDLLDANFNSAVLTLLNYKSHDAGEVFSALNSLSSYNLGNSRFFKKYPDDVRNVTRAVFSALSEHYDKNCKGTLCEKFFGKFYAHSYLMFNSAVFYDQIRREDFVYEINDLCKFTCKNGNWSCETFYRYGGKNQQIGALLKTIDFIMRQKYNFKSALKTGTAAKRLWNIINKAIDKYQEDKREAARPEIEIDVSMLQGIREAALETQSRLLVDELEKSPCNIRIGDRSFPKSAGDMLAPGLTAGRFTARPEKAAIFPDTAPENDTGLSDIENQFMRCLLYGHAYNDPAQSKGRPLSVLVDAVNEKLFNRLGDTAIIETEGRLELIPDYVEELKEIIRE